MNVKSVGSMSLMAIVCMCTFGCAKKQYTPVYLSTHSISTIELSPSKSSSSGLLLCFAGSGEDADDVNLDPKLLRMLSSLSEERSVLLYLPTSGNFREAIEAFKPTSLAIWEELPSHGVDLALVIRGLDSVKTLDLELFGLSDSLAEAIAAFANDGGDVSLSLKREVDPRAFDPFKSVCRGRIELVTRQAPSLSHLNSTFVQVSPPPPPLKLQRRGE